MAPARGRKPPPLTPEEFRQAAGVSRETLARLEQYAALLGRWTRAINLVSRADLADLWRRHMLDSAQLVPLLPPPPAGRRRVLVDLGSGAGFPGLVLAILGAGEVHLIESDTKKAAFLGQAARLSAAPARVHNARIEDVRPFPADVVTARALAPLPRLLAYAVPFLRRAVPGEAGGVALFLKGRDVDGELTASRERWNIPVESVPSRTDPRARILRLGPLSVESEAP